MRAPLSYLLAVCAAMANATSSTLQRKANVAESDDVAFRWQLIRDLLHRPVWFGGILAVIAGFLFQAAALSRGELAIVEPILALELPFTLALAGVVFHRRMHRREWTAAALMTVGLVLLVGSLRPSGGSAVHTSALAWGLGVAGTVTAIAALVAVAQHRSGTRRAALLGIATGATFGLTAAFMTGFSEALRHHLLGVFVHWQVYAMIVAGMTAMFLLQNALQAGSLVAVQPGLTLTDPLVSIIWGVVIFRERVSGGGWYVSALAGAALIAVGTATLSHSTLLPPSGEPPEDRPGPRTRQGNPRRVR